MTEEQTPPEPGEVPDLELGLPGDAEEHPGEEPDMLTEINDDEDEEDA